MRRVLGGVVWLPLPVLALFAAAVVGHREEADPMSRELATGVILAAAAVVIIVVVAVLSTFVAGGFRTASSGEANDPHWRLKLLAAEAAVVPGLAYFWLVDGPVVLAYWCGVVAGSSTGFKVVLLVRRLARRSDAKRTRRPGGTA